MNINNLNINIMKRLLILVGLVAMLLPSCRKDDSDGNSPAVNSVMLDEASMALRKSYVSSEPDGLRCTVFDAEMHYGLRIFIPKSSVGKKIQLSPSMVERVYMRLSMPGYLIEFMGGLPLKSSAAGNRDGYIEPTRRTIESGSLRIVAIPKDERRYSLTVDLSAKLDNDGKLELHYSGDADIPIS